MNVLTSSVTSSRGIPQDSESAHPREARETRRIRAEFLAMPGLKLTLGQAARLFGSDPSDSKRLLERLVEEGFLVRDGRGLYRRSPRAAARRPSLERASGRAAPAEARSNADSRPVSHGGATHTDDVLAALGVELPCFTCDESYRVSLRKIRLSQLLLEAGCQARHFADCPPAALAHVIDPGVLKEFEAAVERIEAAAEGAGGRLIGPR